MSIIKLFFVSTLISFQVCTAQISITSPYFTFLETFGTSGPSSWTNNVSKPGWYLSAVGDYQNYINITTAAPSNNGGFYTYQTAGGGDVKLGSRASASTGALRYGIRLKNDSGSAITGVKISFDYYQLSLATNGGSINTITLDYRISTTAITSLTTGAFTSSGLSYSQLVNNPTGGGTTTLGYPGTQTGSVAATCFAGGLTIPVGSEIMFRFNDLDNANNDHHMAIDNFRVQTYANIICSPLPVKLLTFSGKENNNGDLNLFWATGSEENNDRFEIEGSTDGVTFEKLSTQSGVGKSSIVTNYNQILEARTWEQYQYFRLKQVDFDGAFEVSSVIHISPENEEIAIKQLGNHAILIVNAKNQETTLTVTNNLGQIVFEQKNLLESDSKAVQLPQDLQGFYRLSLTRGLEKISKNMIF